MTTEDAIDLSEGRFERILIPTDGSKASRKALETGLGVAKLMDATVTGLYVLDDSAYAAFPGDVEWDTIKDMLAEEAQRALGELEDACEGHGIDCSIQTREGHPAQQILDASEDHDLLVMGTHGRSGLEHLLLGSVTEKVIRHADCPVLVIRGDEEE